MKNTILISKKAILLFTCIAFFLISTSCEKANQIALLSSHTWVVTATTIPFSTSVGEEYTFHDNRLFFVTKGSNTVDGRWDFGYSNQEIDITTDLTSNNYQITTLTNNELKLYASNVGFGFSGEITFAPKE